MPTAETMTSQTTLLPYDMHIASATLSPAQPQLQQLHQKNVSSSYCFHNLVMSLLATPSLLPKNEASFQRMSTCSQTGTGAQPPVGFLEEDCRLGLAPGHAALPQRADHAAVLLRRGPVTRSQHVLINARRLQASQNKCPLPFLKQKSLTFVQLIQSGRDQVKTRSRKRCGMPCRPCGCCPVGKPYHKHECEGGAVPC
jgi:hypothetical protein